MPTRSSPGPQHPGRRQMAVAAQEFRGVLMVEALVAACAVISHADGRSSPIERWRLSTVLAGDPLLAQLPRDLVAEASRAHRDAFLADPAAARAAALHQVAFLAPEPYKAQIVLDACMLVTHADERLDPAEMQALGDIKLALGL